jgi:hypothetical protein
MHRSMHPHDQATQDRIVSSSANLAILPGCADADPRAPRSFPSARLIRATTGMLAALLLMAAAGCCLQSDRVAPYVAIREAQFRAEEPGNDRIALPLDAAGRECILKFIRAGGDTRTYETGVVDLGADQRYAGLLDWLARDRTLDDLSSSELKPWFVAGPVFQVVDARERYALSDTQVAALSDGFYWWVFYHPRSKHLDQLLVTRVVGAKPRAD